MHEIITESDVFEDYELHYEAEYEDLLEKFSSKIYPEIELFRIKPLFVGILGGGRPDLIGFRMNNVGDVLQWYLVEVELSHHQILEHVLPQIHRFSTFSFSRKDEDVIIREIQMVNASIKSEAIRRAVSTLRPELLVIIDHAGPRLRKALEGLRFETYITEARFFRSMNGERALLVTGYRGVDLATLSIRLISNRPFIGNYRFRWNGDLPPEGKVLIWADEQHLDARVVHPRPGSAEVHVDSEYLNRHAPRLLRSTDHDLKLQRIGSPNTYRLQTE